MMNPIDMFFGAIQGIVALLLLLRVNSLPDMLVYSLAGLLVVSALLDVFTGGA